MNCDSPTVYIIISQTGTLFSRVLKLATRQPYNHVSISFDKDLNLMYSFARKKIYCPWIAGFIEEYPNEGIFKMKSGTKCQIHKLSITEEQYEQLLEALQPFLENPDQYRYNFLGLPFMWFGISLNRRYHYVCSEFVAHLLERGAIIESKQLTRTIKPYEFSMLDETELIYEGFLREYANVI